MTIAISRQPRLSRTVLVIGLVAVVAGVTFGLVRLNGSEPADNDVPTMIRTTEAGLGLRFEAIQNDYLVPQTIVAEQAAVTAELRLQDGYLPPAVAAGTIDEGLLSVQDGYLPPADWAPVQPSEPGTAADRFGPR